MSYAGQFKERVTFYTPGAMVSNGAGGMKATGPETSVTLWARVQVLPAKEDLINGKVTYRQPYKVTVRATGDMNATKRMAWNGRYLSIVSVTPNERATEIQLVGYVVT